MTQRCGIAQDLYGDNPGRGEAQSTFDRLLREYFATLIFSGSPAIGDESRWCETPHSARNHRCCVNTAASAWLDKK
jgi:hypothetical protein